MLRLPIAACAVLALALPLAAAVSGCDSQDSLLGEFRGTVDVAGTVQPVEGEAVYTVVETPRGPEFVLALFVGDLTDSGFDAYDVLVFRRPGLRPGVGAFSIRADPNHRAFEASYARVTNARDPLDAFGPVLRATDGVVSVTSVDGYGFVGGSFRFAADGVRVEAPARRVTGAASGTFEARYEPPATFRRYGLDLGL